MADARTLALALTASEARYLALLASGGYGLSVAGGALDPAFEQLEQLLLVERCELPGELKAWNVFTAAWEPTDLGRQVAAVVGWA